MFTTIASGAAAGPGAASAREQAGVASALRPRVMGPQPALDHLTAPYHWHLPGSPS